jgi:hypothetical protein
VRKRVHAPDFFLDIIFGIEVFDFGGKLGVKVLGIEARDAIDAGFAASRFCQNSSTGDQAAKSRPSR